MESLTISDPLISKGSYVRIYRPAVGNLPVNPEDCLVTYVNDPNEPLVELSGMMHAWTFLISENRKESARERTPFDDPPGVGYNVLLKNRMFIRNKEYKHWDFRITDPVSWRTYYWYDQPLGIYPTMPSFSTLMVGGNGPGSIAESAIAEAYNAALINLYGSLQRRQDMNLGVFVAELKETFGLLGKSMLAITQIIRALKRGRVSDAIKVIKNYGGTVDTSKKYLNRQRLNTTRNRSGDPALSPANYASSMWLELQFGWKPIFDDIGSIMNIINGSLNSSAEGILVFNGYGSIVKSGDDVVIPISIRKHVSPQLPTTEIVNATLSGNVEVKYALNAVYRVSDDFIDVLAQLGLTNPLAIAWELVPFSFVIDWFLPVGQWLNSLQADAGLELIDLTHSVKVVLDGQLQYITTETLTGFDSDGNQWFSTSSSNHSHSIKGRYFTRTVQQQDALPDPPLPSLTFQELIDPWKITTSAALIKVLT